MEKVLSENKIPEIEKNPLRFYICQYLANQNINEEIDFETFLRLIDIFKNNKIIFYCFVYIQSWI